MQVTTSSGNIFVIRIRFASFTLRFLLISSLNFCCFICKLSSASFCFFSRSEAYISENLAYLIFASEESGCWHNTHISFVLSPSIESENFCDDFHISFQRSDPNSLMLETSLYAFNKFSNSRRVLI